MFTTARDMSLVRKLNRELMGNIITQQCSVYQFKLEETKVNLYGEADAEKYYDGPFIFNVLINRSNEEYAENIEGVQSCEVDFASSTAVIVFNDAKTNSSEIINTLNKKTYYKANVKNDKNKGTSI